jgi:sn-1 stearoyl-lipid 9-desaturase
MAQQNTQERGINWLTLIVMVAFHIGAVAAFFFFSWKAFFTMVALWWIAYGWGIGMGYHRLLTHRGYKTPLWLEHTLTFCATLALEGGPIFWVGTHRIHHQNSDREGDPHSPRDGKWWSHMGGIITGKGLHQDTTELARYTPDLKRDPFHVFMTKWHWVPQVVLGVMLLGIGLAVGGWYSAISFVTWAVFFRVVFGLHCTWLVNSATHIWGSRRFTTRDDSTNNFLVAMITFGEGWHNNHHAHPVSARHGLAWYEIDFNWMGISILKWLGLAKDIKVAKLAQPVIVAPEPKSAEVPEMASAAAYD